MWHARLAASVLVALSPCVLFAQSRNSVEASRPNTNDQQLPPPVLHFCAAHCSTWYLKNGHYSGAASGFAGDVTVVSFTRDSVVLDRVDPPNRSFPQGLKAVISGQISPAGNSLANGKITWTFGLSGVFDVRITWGSALNDIPGQDGPPPQPQPQSTVPIAPPPTTPPTSPTSPPTPAPSSPSNPPSPRPNPPVPPPSVPIPAPGSPSPSASAPFDLNGIWQFPGGVIPGGATWSPLKILIVQVGNGLVGTLLEGDTDVPPGAVWMISDGPVSNNPGVYIRQRKHLGGLVWGATDLQIFDLSHFSVGGHLKFTRLTRNTIYEGSCPSRSSFHGSPEEALARGTLYLLVLKDEKTAACWTRTSADAGNRDAQDAYAYDLWKGIGVPQNLPEALSRFQRSAMQGSFYAAEDLADMFAKGEGVPVSNQRARYWRTRMNYTATSLPNYDKNAVPGWARETAGDCDPAKPLAVNAGQAFIQGRVAYQARALPLAACWLQISAAQGFARAKTYLGLMYAFGLGVQKDQPRAFSLIEEVAKTKDPWATMYLAGFYRYGIGTEQNLAQANYLERWVLQVADRGLDVYNQVMGSGPRPTTDEDRQDIADWTALGMTQCPPITISSTSTDVQAHYDCERAKDGSTFGLLAKVFRPHPTLEAPEELLPEFRAW
jgi:TPR repeat protein